MQYSHPWLDLTEAPLMRVNYPEVATEGELRAFLEVLEALVLDTRHPYAWLLDFSGWLPVSSPMFRRLYAATMKRLADHERKYSVGVALFVPNAIVRGIVTAAFWLTPPAFPYRFVASAEEGLTWARERLEAAGSLGRTA